MNDREREQLEHVARLAFLARNRTHEELAAKLVQVMANTKELARKSDHFRARDVFFGNLETQLQELSSLVEQSYSLSSTLLLEAGRQNTVIRALMTSVQEYLPTEETQAYPEFILMVASNRGTPPDTVDCLKAGEAIFTNRDVTIAAGMIKDVRSIEVVGDRYDIFFRNDTHYSVPLRPENEAFLIFNEDSPIPRALLNSRIASF